MGLFGTISNLINAAKEIVDEVEDRASDWSEEMEAISFGDEYAKLSVTVNNANTLAESARSEAESNLSAFRQVAETAQQQAISAQTQGQALQTLADSTLASAQSNIASLEGALTSQITQQLNTINTELTNTIRNNLNDAVQQIIAGIQQNNQQ